MDWIVRNWLIVAGAMLLLTAGAGLLQNGGLPGVGSILQGTVWWAAAATAIADGLLRASGRPSLLGSGRGMNRILAVVQVILGLLLIGTLLPPGAG